MRIYARMYTVVVRVQSLEDIQAPNSGKKASSGMAWQTGQEARRTERACQGRNDQNGKKTRVTDLDLWNQSNGIFSMT